MKMKKNSIITICFSLVAIMGLLFNSCSEEKYSLKESNITKDSFTFTVTPGSDEWTYNFNVAFNTAPNSIYSTQIDFGDGKSAAGPLMTTATHEYISLAGNSFTATCILTIPDGSTFIQVPKTITIVHDNPKAIMDDPASLQFALTGGKANTAGKKWFIGDWTAMRDPNNRNSVWWDFKNAALLNDNFIFIPHGVEVNGKFIYNNNGDTHMNESLGSLFPDGSTAGSFVTTQYTPPTDATWDISEIGGKTILTIYKGFFGYAFAPGNLDKTQYEVLSFSPKSIRVVNYDTNPSAQIWCWELTLTDPNAPKPSGNWVDVDSPDNMWHGVTFTNTFYYAPNWAQLPDPGLTVDGTQYSTGFPAATFAQWQNQIHFIPDNALVTSSAKNYDFRITMTATKDISQATVKLTQIGDDNNFLFTKRVDLSAGKEVVATFVDLPGVDMSSAKLVLDFGGNPDNTDVVIKDIILQTHR